MSPVRQPKDAGDIVAEHADDPKRARLSIAQCVDSAEVMYVDKPRFTDAWNAEYFAKLEGHRVKHVAGWGWIAFDGKRWVIDEKPAWEILKRCMIAMNDEVSRQADEQREKMRNHAQRSEGASAMAACMKLAASDPAITAHTGHFDTHPWLFNVANGTIDLRTGVLHEHDASHMITKYSDVVYQPEATCTEWLKFLRTIMGGDDELVSFLQRIAGYWLTGSIQDRKVLFFLNGPGANGKSSFANVVRELMGEYARQAPAALFLEQKGGGPMPELARLVGARGVFCSEAPREGKGAMQVIKTLGGGEPIPVRKLYHDTFEFVSQAKVIWGVNHRPKFADDDPALWDRIYEIPFDVIISQGDREPEEQLQSRLCAELSGILSWAVTGLSDWKTGGLAPPDAVLRATAGYRNDMNPLHYFLREECVLEAAATESLGGFWSAYQAWADRNGEAVIRRGEFNVRIGALTGVKRDRTEGRRFWSGIRLRSWAAPTAG